jgi:GTPase SAR1 family protein
MNSTESKSDYSLKILTIGESGVGKTCVLLRYTDNKFIKNHLTTIGKINLNKASITRPKTSSSMVNK